MRYALVDKDGNVVNVISWDGVTPYTPADGLVLVNIQEGEESKAEPGSSYSFQDGFTKKD